MKTFYIRFLGGTVEHETADGALAFLRYDDEHHRIALLRMPGVKNKDYDTCGLEHMAFTYDSLRDLCTAYRQRKSIWGVEPGWCVVCPSLPPGLSSLIDGPSSRLGHETSILTPDAEPRRNDLDVLPRPRRQRHRNPSR